MPSLQWRRGDRQSGAAAPYLQPRASWSAGPDTARPLGGAAALTAPIWGPPCGGGGVGEGVWGGVGGRCGGEVDSLRK